MSQPFHQIAAPQERAALSRLSLDDLKLRLGAYAIAAPNAVARTISGDAAVRRSADLDDWSGSFDMHLGVYTSE